MNTLTNIWERIEKIFKNDFANIILIAFFNILPWRLVGFLSQDTIIIKILKFGFRFAEFFLLIFILFFCLSFLKEKIRKIIINILFFLSAFLFLIEIILFSLFGYIISTPVLQILLETNKNESIEFLKTYFHIKYIFFIILAFIFIFGLRKVFQKIFPMLIDFIFKLKILKIIFIFLLVFKIFNLNYQIDMQNSSFGRLYIAQKECRQIFKDYKEIEAMKNNAKILSKERNIENIVFIIGESTTKNHMSLYGYKNDTNPLLKKLEKEGNLYKFTDTVSSHAGTIPNIKKILTFYDFESDKDWYNYTNIIDIMKATGYHTYWFSNQESSGIWGNIAVALGKRSDTVVFNNFYNSQEYFIKDNYDEQIVDKSLDYILDKNNFIIYHLLGAHSDYKKRYPKEYEYFKNNNPFISSYDNAILYNDYVVNKIIDNFKDKEAIVIYIPDHGEEVYDFRNFKGHSENNGSRYMIEIPFLIYVSDKFKNNYPDTVKDIENSLNNPYMTDDIIHTILDIAKIKTEEFDERKSIINKNFNSSRKRIFSGKDYETFWKNKN